MMQKPIEKHVKINYKNHFLLLLFLFINILNGSNLQNIIYKVNEMSFENNNKKYSTDLIKGKCGFSTLLKFASLEKGLDKSKKINRTFSGLNRPQNLNKTLNTKYFKIHYTSEGVNSVDTTDINLNQIPDFIDYLIEAADSTYEIEINQLNYNKPPSDLWQIENGGDSAYDIYVYNLGDSFYGYTQPENLANSFKGDNGNSLEIEKNSSTSFIAINNNFDFLDCKVQNCIKTTFSHEFFHAIQLGYDSSDAPWFLEATATWIEDEVFDEINDNYQYLKLWMKIPHVALNKHRSPYWYGSWIFFRYISEHIGGNQTIKEIFNQSIIDDSSIERDLSLETIDVILKSKGYSYNEVLSKMSISNYLLTSQSNIEEFNYEEAIKYREFGIEPHIHQSLGINSTNTLIEYFGPFLMQNASHYIKLSLNNEINNLEIDFTSLENSKMTAYVISNENSNNLNIHRIRNSTPIPIYKGNNVLSIILTTDSISNFDYHYSIQLKSDIKFPTSLYIDSNFPNPFHYFTSIRFFLPVFENISLSIIDLNGKKIKDIPIDRVQVGYNELKVDTSDLVSGIYFFKLDGETNSFSKKITLIK